jgi:hypothetical protein
VGIPSYLNALSMGQAQGRYLLPAVGALALLGGLGACGGPAPRRGLRAAAALAVLLAAANLAALFGVLRPAYAEPVRGHLSRVETPGGPLLVQHGPAAAGNGFAPAADGRWILAAPQGAALRTSLEARLAGRRTRSLLGAAVDSPALDDPARLPGVAAVHSEGPGSTIASRVRPGWIRVGDQRRRALLAHPTSRIALEAVPIPEGARLRARFAIREEAWEQPGDGVTFRLLALPSGGDEILLEERYLDPKDNPAERRWAEWVLDAGALGGRTATLILETLPGPAGNHAHDWAGWAGLWIESSSDLPTPALCDTVAGNLLDPAALDLDLPPGGALTLRLPPGESKDSDLRLVLHPSGSTAPGGDPPPPGGL